MNNKPMLSVERDSIALEALMAARQFIANGIELGFISMPEAETPDPAHDTLPIIDLAIAELKTAQQQGEPVAQSSLTFNFMHPSTKERRAVTLTKAQVADGMEDTLYEQLNKAICSCEPVGETNVVDCNCWDYTDDFDLVVDLAEQPAPVAVVPEGYCIMPRRLTAENGAKTLMLGEFTLEVTMECPECVHMEEPSEGCEICDGEGEYGQKHTIPWNQIKFIYSKAVEGLAIENGAKP